MKTIGILGAMPSELKDIQGAQGNPVRETLSGYDFYQSEYEGRTLVTVCSGVGKVNAACCTQLLIDHFGAAYVINTGIAGGVKKDIHVLEMAVSKSVCQHDLDAHFLDAYPPYQSEFPSDEALCRLAGRVCEERGIPCHFGRIISGDAFITDTAAKAALAEKFDPCAVDMESAAAGMCAARAGVPFVSVRCISDLADDDGAMSFETFETRAARRVAEVVLEMAKRL